MDHVVPDWTAMLVQWLSADSAVPIPASSAIHSPRPREHVTLRRTDNAEPLVVVDRPIVDVNVYVDKLPDPPSTRGFALAAAVRSSLLRSVGHRSSGCLITWAVCGPPIDYTDPDDSHLRTRFTARLTGNVLQAPPD